MGVTPSQRGAVLDMHWCGISIRLCTVLAKLKSDGKGARRHHLTEPGKAAPPCQPEGQAAAETGRKWKRQNKVKI